MEFTSNCKIAKLVLSIDAILIIPNKSSCLAAFVLGCEPSWTVYWMEYTASGNEISHLIWDINDTESTEINRKCVIALDYDRKRCNTLK